MKKLLLAASGLFLAAFLYIGIDSHKNLNTATDLLLANVEALTTYVEGGCSSCGGCEGNFIICVSQTAHFWSDFYRNCSGGSPNIQWLEGC